MDSIAIYYLAKLPLIRDTARKLGYAVAIHGSLSRDFDLIAVPWVEDARPVDELVEAVRLAINGTIIPTGTPGGRWDKATEQFVPVQVVNPAIKPHGRLAWSIGR